MMFWAFVIFSSLWSLAFTDSNALESEGGAVQCATALAGWVVILPTRESHFLRPLAKGLLAVTAEEKVPWPPEP